MFGEIESITAISVVRQPTGHPRENLRLVPRDREPTRRRHDIERVFIPSYSSWLNLRECQFQGLRSFAFNGSDYPSHAHQDAAIRAYLRWHNRNARPAKAWRLNTEVHHSIPDVAV